MKSNLSIIFALAYVFDSVPEDAYSDINLIIICQDEHDKIKTDFTIDGIEEKLNLTFDVTYLTKNELELRLVYHDFMITTFLHESIFLLGDRDFYDDCQKYLENKVSHESITFNQNMNLELLDNAIICFRSVKFYWRWSTMEGYPSSRRLYNLIIEDEIPYEGTPSSFLKEIKHYQIECYRNLHLAMSYLFGVIEMKRLHRVLKYNELLKEDKFQFLIDLSNMKTRIKKKDLTDIIQLKQHFDRVLTEFQKFYKLN